MTFHDGGGRCRACGESSIYRSRGSVRTGLLVGLAATLAAIIAGRLEVFNTLELKWLDVRIREFNFARPDSNIVLVFIDDKSLEKIGRWPWPRRYMGEMIRLCREAGAREVNVDIIFPEPQPLELVQPGLTDHNPYESPLTYLLAKDSFSTINNDKELIDDITQAGGVTLAFHGEPKTNEEKPSDDPQYEQLLAQMRNWVMAHPDRTDDFAESYLSIYPDADIKTRNDRYQQALKIYMHQRSLEALSQYSWPLPTKQPQVPIIEMTDLIAPLPEMINAADDCGFVTVRLDEDGKVRRIPLLARYGDRLYPQLAFLSACKHLGVTYKDIDLSSPHCMKMTVDGRVVTIPLDDEGMMLINWVKYKAIPATVVGEILKTIPASFIVQIFKNEEAFDENKKRLKTIENISWQLEGIPQDRSGLSDGDQRRVAELESQLAALPDIETLEQANQKLYEENIALKQELHVSLNDKIVFIGSNATGAADFVITPLDRTADSRTPGVVVHANILNTVLQYANIFQPSTLTELLVTLFLGILLTVIASLGKPSISGLTLVAIILLAVFINFIILFHWGHYWYAFVTPLAAILASFTCVTFYRQIFEGRTKRRITARFKQYAAPALVDRIVQAADTLTFAGETRVLTCYFSDLAGFTTISEHLGPEKTVSVLNIYLDRMTEVLDRHLGTVNKFQGDGVFAFFGAPAPLDDHAVKACSAALDAQAELARLCDEQRREDNEFPNLTMRIGLSTGPVVVGDCGSQRRFDYTAIGDNVNLASRLESANKAFGTHIMISQDTRDAVGDQFAFRYLGGVRVVGKQQSVGIYELIGPADSLAPNRRTFAERFEMAVREYQTGNFTAALEHLDALAAEHPADKSILLYQRTCRELLTTGKPDDFDGSITLSEK
ncbi:MAG: adenylate/guanylate cyclase domain-containing protein [Sedimentisphaerales bacterium]|nr:adenylate/guanylate cyclase domain-containing protein [Sedimentisphaerales bacterium]